MQGSVLSKNAANQHEVLEEEMYISKDGYMETFVVNETSEDVWFDNLMVMSVSSAIVQETHGACPDERSDIGNPWGLELTGLGYEYEGIKANKYLYQGKEMMDDQNLNIYDFHARGYDPVIGRTLQIDPGSESYYPNSPYSWVMNNPLKFVDPTGMFADYFDKYGEYVGTDGVDDGEIRVLNQDRYSLPNNYYGEDGVTVSKEVGTSNSKLLDEVKFKGNEGALESILNHYLGELGFDKNAVAITDINATMRGNPNTNETSIALNRSGYINYEEFNNYYNLRNTAVHERYHIDNHKNVNTKKGKGSIEHLKTYNAQIEHSTWGNTTESHQKHIIGNITDYISTIPQADGGKLQNASRNYFGRKLGIKISW